MTKGKVGILLGNEISRKGTLSHEALTRVKKAHALLKKGEIETLVLTGGHRNHLKPKVSEARLYWRYLTSKGISRKKLILEEESKETLGNAIFSKKLVTQQKSKSLVLITSNYHMKRSLMVFQHIFGNKYSFESVTSRPKLRHKVQNMLAEMESEGIDDIFLSQIKKGDHRKAKKLLIKQLPVYK